MDGSDFDKKLKEKIQDLDKEFPAVGWNEEDLWNAIHARQKQGRRIYWVKLSSGIAAGVLLISSVVYFQWNRDKENVTIRYSEETDITIKSNTGTNPERSTVRKLIEEKCRTQSQICQSLEFRELKTQFDDLENQAQDMDLQLKLFGEDPALLKAQGKIKKVQALVGKDLMQMLGS